MKTFASLSFVALLGLCGCGSSDGTKTSPTATDEFAAYWADGSAWCTRTDECGLRLKADCEAGWATKTATLATIRDLGFSSTYLSRCDTAAHALDKCALVLSCSDFQLYATALSTGPCATQRSNFNRLCGELNNAMLFPGDGGVSDDAGKASDDAGR